MIQQDAVEVLRERMAPASLDAILVLFPDPWHKKRHHKRRLVNAEFASLAVSRLTAGRYSAARHGLDALRRINARGTERRARSCRTRSPDGGYVPRNPGRVRTRFEARGERLGHAVHDLCFERISPSGG